MNTFPGQSLQGASAAQTAVQAEFRARVLERLKEKQAAQASSTPQALQPAAKETIQQAPINRVPEASSTLFPPSDTVSLPEATSIKAKSPETASHNWLQDVQDIAQKSGIIDLRAQDILRAQYTGDSILADYLV